MILQREWTPPELRDLEAAPEPPRPYVEPAVDPYALLLCEATVRSATHPDVSQRRLTPCQMAIIQQLAAGRTAKQAARQLGIAVGPVKAHIALATAKLGAENAAMLWR